MRDGSKLTKKVNYKGRRDESKGEEKALGKRAYSSVDTMDDAMLDLENFYEKGGKVLPTLYDKANIFVLEYMPYTSTGNRSEQRKFRKRLKIQEAIDMGNKFFKTGEAHTVFVYPDHDVLLTEGYDVLYRDGGNSYDDVGKGGNSIGYAEGGEIKGRYEVRVDGRPSYAVYDDLDEAYDDFIDTRSSYRYETDVMIIDTKYNETIEYYDAQEDREQSDEFAKGGTIEDITKSLKEKYRGIPTISREMFTLEKLEDGKLYFIPNSFEELAEENDEQANDYGDSRILKRIQEDVDKMYAKGGKTQGYNARLDESLAMRRGKAKTKKQSKKDRRDESKAMEKAKGKRAYSSVKTMDKKVKYRGKK